MLTPVNTKVAQKIRKLIPFATFSLARFNAVCAKIQLYAAQPGEFLFKKNDATNELVYLLEGEVSLQALGMQVEIVHADSYSGKLALAHQIPRKIDAVALTPVVYIRLNAEYLTMLVDEDEQEVNDNMGEVKSNERTDDWMTTLLKTPIFKRLPPANLQKLLTGFQEISVPKDCVILKQGDPGQYYYLIKQGQCALSRRPNVQAREIMLAQLRIGDMFGEDSLLSDQPISTTVTALTPMMLLRLDKEAFLSLIVEPTLKYVDVSELLAETQAGALIMDVRLQDAYEIKHLKGSLSVPFFSLRMQLQLKMFERNIPVIVVCDDGKMSRAAAFLLLRYKISAKILQQGLQSLEQVNLPVSLAFVTGSEAGSAGLAALAVTKPIAPSTETAANSNEAAQLKAELKALQQMYQKVVQEKALLEKNYRLLLQQTEKLKEALYKLQK